jgi:hypothetical protein
LTPISTIIQSSFPAVRLTRQKLRYLESIQLIREQRDGESRTLPTMLDRSCSAASRFVAHHEISCYTHAATAAFPCRLPAIPNSACRRLEQTALVPHSPLGWAEISHPFHPLRGRRFEVLKKRRVAGVDTLILRELERGTLSVPREWTDWADPSPYDSLTRPPHQLAADCLFELVALLDALPASRPSSPGKDPQEKD